MAYKAPNMAENGEEMQIPQIYESSLSPTSDEALPIQKTGGRSFTFKHRD